MWSVLARRCAVLLAYLVAACVATWPLPVHLGDRLTGDPGGDTGVYVWNQWVFRHEVVLKHNPFTTDQILSLTQRTDLSQHNYTAFLDLLALPLIPFAGVVATFNLVLLAQIVMTALATYALARRVTSATRSEAWLAGLAFACSPVLMARTIGHFSLVAAAPLPVFLLCMRAAEETRAWRHAALAGLCVAWAAFCDAYYGVFCVMLVGVYVVMATFRVSRRPLRAAPPWLWLFDIAMVCLSGLVLGLLTGRGGQFDVLGVRVNVRGLYTPMLVLTIMALVRLVIVIRPRVVPVWHRHLVPVHLLLIGAIACIGSLSPVLYGLGQRIVDGRYVNPPVLWRSSPRGVDLLSFITPNPVHPITRWVLGDPRVSAPTTYVEYTASLSLVALAVVAWAVWKAGFRPRPGWWLLTAGFAALALGPFVWVGGVNTYIPGPWALFRYVPVVGVARMPTRFAVIAALGLAILLAGALAAIGSRWPERRRLITASVGLLLGFELLPAPAVLHSASISAIYDIVAADPRPVRLLGLPVGVRDGVSSSGNFSARSQFHQTRHGKRLIGGYLSRISATRLSRMRAEYLTLDRLITLSEGHAPTADDESLLMARGPGFVQRSMLGYVVIDASSFPPESAALVRRALRLREIARDGALVLYVPAHDDIP